MDYVIREMRNEEFGLLGDFLYEAIYIPDGIEPPPKSVIECPELQEYIVGFLVEFSHWESDSVKELFLVKTVPCSDIGACS